MFKEGLRRDLRNETRISEYRVCVLSCSNTANVNISWPHAARRKNIPRYFESKFAILIHLRWMNSLTAAPPEMCKQSHRLIAVQIIFAERDQARVLRKLTLIPLS